MRAMRSLALPFALLTLLFAAAPASAAGPSGVRLTACQSSLEQAERVAAFEARMRRVAGAARLQMRFTLQTRTGPAERWHALPAAGFGKWLTSEPGVGRFVYTKRLVALNAPAAYRTLVRFRWLGADGRQVASSRAISPSCRQLDLRPDLHALRVGVSAADAPNRARYAVPVTNRGKTAAGPFDVVVTVDDKALTAFSVLALAAGESVIVDVEGPRCREGGALTVDVDPTGAVDERAEADNRLTTPCPVPAAPA